jgi:hypothetical protein
MLEWKRVFSPTSEAQIEVFEKDNEISLPPQYKRFLLTTNGGVPSVYTGFVIPELKEKVLLGALYGITNEDDHALGLAKSIAEYKDVLPPTMIPIGVDPGGNQLLLITTGEQVEGVLFWDRVGFLTKRTGGKSAFHISANIGDFIDSLQVVEDK